MNGWDFTFVDRANGDGGMSTVEGGGVLLLGLDDVVSFIVVWWDASDYYGKVAEDVDRVVGS
eukprot:scaffold146952_cov36-Cyclotella_meneghiniana.AAC.1